ncbi:phytase [Trametes versicolor FP-101664 SS1]|uniref:phytase n=1 Tax=Trametes versicolor (strain FP-101664) TaxID=717944 RepID=UPI0004623BDB|nr:phytase [Trametes versicolor FP-101664 SS1]EIW61545.1 phytase [Trametes versicolor FP-101664 SS1]
MAFSILASLLFVCYAYARAVPRAYIQFRDTSACLNVTRDVQQSWSMYSPYFPAADYVAPPASCQINQVHIIQRHGARFPTSGAAKRIQAAVAKLKAASNYTDPLLAFVTNYTYSLGQDSLVELGATQSSEAGQEAFARYSSLVSADELPFVRASGSDRVVATANNWTAGFALASSDSIKPVLSVIISEAGNDTLDDNMCPAAGDSDTQVNEWLAQFAPPMTARLNAGAPGANLTDTDTYNLLTLCPFETVATEQRSEFCDIYEELQAEAAFAYNADLDKFYGTGYGQPLGPVQGVGYINELIARLTAQNVSDHTQTNSTLDSSPDTFPLNRTLYADFSHDNQMVAIFSAMGLFNQSAPLDPTSPDPARTFLVNKIVPFSARMVVERLDCGGAQSVRLLVNDAVQPLEFCGADASGVCTLDAFVESQAYARNDGEGDFEKCFAT